MTLLDNIRARIAAATPGPWQYDGFVQDSTVNLSVYPCEKYDPNVEMQPIVDKTPALASDIHSEGDAEMIANAPSDLAALVSIIDAVLEKHTSKQETYFGGGQATICRECRFEYPCPTVQTITGVESGDSYRGLG